MSALTASPLTASPPTGTYRLQLRPDFGFKDAAAVTPYLADLGVSHLYLSPILQAAPGSAHGYDVVDHDRLSDALGGGEAFHELTDDVRRTGLGIVVDVVPNHMAVPTPVQLNAALWSVLREGPSSPYASWFDIDWAAQERAILMPVLGRRIGDAVRDGEIALDSADGEPVLRYFDKVFPVRRGTEHLPLDQLLDRQFYRLAYWRVGDEELNYRRFFDIDTLVALRVEDERVYAETHAVLLALVAEGRVAGLRIDHPDGLAGPRDYLRRLRDSTGGAWVVVEKILEGLEELPADWPCAGTTGYDALLRAGAVFIDPAAAEELTDVYADLTGETASFADVAEHAKRWVVEHGLHAEVHRLVEVAATICHENLALRDHTRRALREAVVEVLAAFPVYRAYVVPGEPAPVQSRAIVDGAVDAAIDHLADDRHDTARLIGKLALGDYGTNAHLDEFVTRFQQTCGPVMAKGVEDTAFYRYLRFTAVNEVGGDPAHIGVELDEFHAWCERRQRTWPTSMTTLSTHDTKRSEDVRARLFTLSERVDEWRREVERWRAATASYRPEIFDANTDYLLWQTLVGAWPIDAERLDGYLEKATREAKRHTTWTEPNQAYDDARREFSRRVLADDNVVNAVSSFVDRLAPAFRVNVLGQKLVALTMPGVPDIYQGCELVDLSLVDPDNRRAVDYGDRRQRLDRLAGGTAGHDLDDEKLLVVTTALRLRREHPEWFGADAGYVAVPASTPHALAFARGRSVITVATRLPEGLRRGGGWREDALDLPDGSWRDRLTDATWTGALPLASLLGELPVALLVREE